MVFNKNVGRMAVDLYDFNKHLDGSDFRHQAESIDLSSPLTSLDNAENVQSAFTSLDDYLLSLTSKGEGFIAIGDGYDTWHAANGTINYDNSIPALNLVLKPILDAIINNTTIPEGYERIKFGGIILLKAGTYIVTETIDIPPGIHLLGEGYGTKIVNASRLDISSLPPTRDLGESPQPVFNIKTDPNRSTNDAGTDPNLFIFSRKTKISNLVIADNFVENTILGDVFYKQPQNIEDDTPLINQETGSNLVLEDVYLLGKVNFTSVTIVNEATQYAIRLEDSAHLTTGTHLTINNCFIDGCSIPVDFQSYGGSKDYLLVQNSKIRAYGYLDGYASGSTYNTMFRVNDNNTLINDNYLSFNGGNFTTGVFVKSVLASPPSVQALAKIAVSNNNVFLDKTNTLVPSNLPTFSARFLSYDSGITSNTIQARLVALTYGNNFDLNSSFGSTLNFGFQGANAIFTLHQNGAYLDGYAEITGALDVNGTLDVDGYATFDARHIVNAADYLKGTVLVGSGSINYTVLETDALLLVKTLTQTASIVLPSASAYAYRKIRIKDIDGNAETNNITLQRAVAGNKIEGLTADAILSANFGKYTLWSSGEHWYFI